MSGFISIEMYLALAEELKAYKDQNRFLEKEIKEMRAKNQELRVHSVNVDEQMGSTHLGENLGEILTW